MLDFRRRDCRAGAAVRRVLRVGVDGAAAGLRDVFRVLRTGGESVAGSVGDVRRVLRADPAGFGLTSLVEVVGRAPGCPLGRALGGVWREGVDEGG